MHEQQIKIVTILAGVLLALVALITLVEGPEDTGPADEDEETFVDLAPDLEASGVTALSVERGSERVRFEREGEGWRITAPLAAPASHDAVEAFLDRMLRLELGEGIETDELAAFGLEPPVAVLTLEAEGTEPLRLEVGEDAPVGYRTYVRDAEGLVRTTRDRLGPALEIELRDFRELDLVDVSTRQLTALVLRRQPAAGAPEGATDPGGELRLERVEAGWQLAGAAPLPADADTIERLVRELDALEVVEFPAAPLPSPEAWVLTLETETGTRELRLGEPDSEGLVVASAPLQAEPVLVSAEILEGLSLDPAAWQSRRLLDFDAGSAQELSVVLGERSLAASRSANGWEPVAGEELVDALQAVRVDRSRAVAGRPGSDWGHVRVQDLSGQVQERPLVRDEAGQIYVVEGERAVPLPSTEVQRLEDAAG